MNPASRYCSGGFEQRNLGKSILVRPGRVEVSGIGLSEGISASVCVDLPPGNVVEKSNEKIEKQTLQPRPPQRRISFTLSPNKRAGELTYVKDTCNLSRSTSFYMRGNRTKLQVSTEAKKLIENVPDAFENGTFLLHQDTSKPERLVIRR